MKPHRRVKVRLPIDHACFQRKMLDYLERRMQRLRIVKTTITSRDQTIDWIPNTLEVKLRLPARPLPHQDFGDASW